MLKISKVTHQKIKGYAKKLWKEFNVETGFELDENDFYFEVRYNKERLGYFHIKITSTVSYLEDLILKSEERSKGFGYEIMKFFEDFQDCIIVTK